MKYHLTPRSLTALAVTTVLTLTNVTQAQTASGPADSRDSLAKQLASATSSLDRTARRQVAVEMTIDQARVDVDRIAIELVNGRDPKSVTQELQKVRTRVDRAEKALTGVISMLGVLHDTFTKIQIAAATLDTPSIAVKAGLGLRRTQTLQTRAEIDQEKIGKLNQDILALLDMARG